MCRRSKRRQVDHRPRRRRHASRELLARLAHQRVGIDLVPGRFGVLGFEVDVITENRLAGLAQCPGQDLVGLRLGLERSFDQRPRLAVEPRQTREDRIAVDRRRRFRLHDIEADYGRISRADDAKQLRLGRTRPRPTSDLLDAVVVDRNDRNLPTGLARTALHKSEVDRASIDQVDEVAMDHFNRAIERIVAGLEKKNRLMNPRERRVIAHHEMGHALVARAIPGSDPVHKVSIIPRGIAALGYTIQRPIEDRFLMSRLELANKMTILLGGRAAESIFFDDVSTGASDDLAKATGIARSMVTRYGMDEKLGLVSLESERSAFLQGPADLAIGQRDFSEETAREVDCAVRDLVQRAFEQAVGILKRHREMVVETAERLLEKETLLGNELPEIVDMDVDD